MMFWRKLPKALFIGLTLAIAVNLLLVFSSKGTLQNLFTGGLHRELPLHLNKRDGAVIKRLSHLEVELQDLSKFTMLSWKVCVWVCVFGALRKKGHGRKHG